jgi:hypothetical protein
MQYMISMHQIQGDKLEGREDEGLFWVVDCCEQSAKDSAFRRLKQPRTERSLVL